MMPKNGRGWFAFVLLLASTLSWPIPAAAEVLFKADFETGDFSQFSGKSRNIKPGHIEVVTDIVHSGKYAGRFTIHEDNVFNARQLRVQANGPKVTVKEGSDTFVSFYMYMKDAPKDRDNFFYWEGSPPPRYNNVMTWWVEPKKDGAGTSIKYGTGNLGRKGVHWEGDFTIGRWHQLGMHIHWSEDPAKGNVKLWWDGVVVLDKKVQTKGPQTRLLLPAGDPPRPAHQIGGHHLFRRLPLRHDARGDQDPGAGEGRQAVVVQVVAGGDRAVRDYLRRRERTRTSLAEVSPGPPHLGR